MISSYKWVLVHFNTPGPEIEHGFPTPLFRGTQKLVQCFVPFCFGSWSFSDVWQAHQTFQAPPDKVDFGGGKQVVCLF